MRYILLVLLFVTHSVSYAKFEVSYSFTDWDLEHNDNVKYEVALLRLILDKTADEYGDYTLSPILKGEVTQKRSMEFMRTQRYKNYVRTFGYNKNTEKNNDLAYVKFPIYRGLLGYRVCFVSDKIKDAFSTVSSKVELIKYSIGIGVGWADGETLRYNGFQVREIPRFSSLYKMTASNRIDLFCRGANEALSDYTRAPDIPGLHFDTSIAIYYPVPHFFYTHKSNTVLLERISKGITKAFEDGSMQMLWQDVFEQSIGFVDLNKRKLFAFDSPLTDSIDFDYQKFIFQPQQTSTPR